MYSVNTEMQDTRESMDSIPSPNSNLLSLQELEGTGGERGRGEKAGKAQGETNLVCLGEENRNKAPQSLWESFVNRLAIIDSNGIASQCGCDVIYDTIEGKENRIRTLGEEACKDVVHIIQLWVRNPVTGMENFFAI
jgi:hypothetical protein